LFYFAFIFFSITFLSITSEDWPAVKAHLEERMAAYTPSLSGRGPG
jgi:hypothetical protein